MESILIGKQKVNLNFETQISPNGREFRLSGISILKNTPPIWKNNMYLHNTIYSFKYLDDESFFEVYINANGSFDRLVKNT